MADIQIEGTVEPFTGIAPRALVYTSAQVGYVFYIDAAGPLAYRKTTDGGATWGSAVTIRTGALNNTVIAFDVWYDKWTTGGTGTVIHIWYVARDTDDVFYRSFDTATDTLGTERTVFAGASADDTTTANCTGCKARGGNLYVASMIDNGVEFIFARSTDGGVNWTSRADPFEATAVDRITLHPGNESDNQDIWALFLDGSANALTLKTYDDSANSWSESSTIATVNDVLFDYSTQWGAHVRQSDNHLLCAVWTEKDTATADFRVFDINGASSIVEKTAIATNIDDSFYPSLFIDQTTDALYVAYIGKKDGSETLDTTASVCYVVSTDGGATWSAETVYSATASDWRVTWTPQQGDRFAVAWIDTSPRQLLINVDNSLVLGAQFKATLTGELRLTAPTLSTFWPGVSFTGEGQLASPDLTLFAWSASLRGEGGLTADLTSKDFRASLHGEAAWALADLVIFPGWAAAMGGELQATAALTTSAFEASLRGEGSLTAALSTFFSADLRGELQATANLSTAFSFAATLRGEGQWSSATVTTFDPWLPPASILLKDDIVITENLNGPATLKMTAQEFAPELGAAVSVVLAAEGLFSGTIRSRRRYWVENKYRRAELTAIDHAWALSRKRISKRFRNVSATDIVLEIANGSGLDVTGVQPGLPTIEDLRFSRARRSDALTTVLQQIGGSWRIAYPNKLIAGVGATAGEDPEPLTPQHPTLLKDPSFEVSDDLGQVVNQVRVKGAGASVVAAPPGEYPDYWDAKFTAYYGLDRTRFYPASSQRIYLDTIKIEEPDLVDANGLPFNPPKKVPPRRIFSGSGTVLIDDLHEVPYIGAGEQQFFVAFNADIRIASVGGGSLPAAWEGTEGEGIGQGILFPHFIGGWGYVYDVTAVTEWGESSSGYRYALGSLGYDLEYVRRSDGSPDYTQLPILTPHRSVAITIHRHPNTSRWVQSFNVYRKVMQWYGVVGKEPVPEVSVLIGSIPVGGGVVIDGGGNIPSEGATDELPTKDESQRPPMPYIDIAAHQMPIPVGASVRVVRTVNDLPSQAVMAAILGDDGVIAGDDVDNSDWTAEDLEAAGRAHLLERSPVKLTAKWDCRDRRTHVGCLQAIDMPGIRGEFTIQSVQIDTFAPYNYDGTGLTIAPVYHATAASRSLVTLEGVLLKGLSPMR